MLALTARFVRVGVGIHGARQPVEPMAQCSDVRMRYFGVASPTSTTIQIGGLAQPETMVEIEIIAVVE